MEHESVGDTKLFGALDTVTKGLVQGLEDFEKKRTSGDNPV